MYSGVGLGEADDAAADGIDEVPTAAPSSHRCLVSVKQELFGC